MAIWEESTTRLANTRLREAVTVVEDRRTQATGARRALQSGTRLNVNVATIEMAIVNANTVVSGLKPVSIPDQEASERVAETANSHAKAAPAPTSKRLS